MRQARTDGEDVHRTPGLDQAMPQTEQRVGIGTHRPADIDQQDQAARAGGAAPVPDRAGLAQAAHLLPQRGARVDAAAARRPQARRGPHRKGDGYAAKERREGLAFPLTQAGDVAMAEHLGGAGHGGHEIVVLFRVVGRRDPVAVEARHRPLLCRWLGRQQPGQLTAEPGLEDLVMARAVLRARTQGGAPGDQHGIRILEPEHPHGVEIAAFAVCGDPHAGRTDGPRERE